MGKLEVFIHCFKFKWKKIKNETQDTFIGNKIELLSQRCAFS